GRQRHARRRRHVLERHHPGRAVDPRPPALHRVIVAGKRFHAFTAPATDPAVTLCWVNRKTMSGGIIASVENAIAPFQSLVLAPKTPHRPVVTTRFDSSPVSV